MASVRCKVRLEDGSEVGPLDGAMVRSWYEQGLIDDDTPVLPSGARSWGPLASLVDISQWRGPKRRARAEEDDEEEDETPRFGVEGRWRSLVACLLLLSWAGVAGYFAFFPEGWRGELADVPWRELALGLLAVGLLLVRGWDLGRKLVRGLAVAAAFALFLPAGFLLAQGQHGRPLLIVFCAWLAASGLFFLLTRSLRTLGALAALLATLVGFGGATWLGLATGPSWLPPARQAGPAQK